MIWHYLKEVVAMAAIVHGLLGFRHPVQEGPFRRLWNRPMRFAVVCWLLAWLMGSMGIWLRGQPGWTSFGNNFGYVAIIATTAGIVSLGVFLAGFLMTMLRDFRPENRPAPVEDDIDQVQRLLLHGQRHEAIKLYQDQNHVAIQEAEEAVDAIGAALQAGLRV